MASSVDSFRVESTLQRSIIDLLRTAFSFILKIFHPENYLKTLHFLFYF